MEASTSKRQTNCSRSSFASSSCRSFAFVCLISRQALLRGGLISLPLLLLLLERLKCFAAGEVAAASTSTSVGLLDKGKQEEEQPQEVDGPGGGRGGRAKSTTTRFSAAPSRPSSRKNDRQGDDDVDGEMINTNSRGRDSDENGSALQEESAVEFLHTSDTPRSSVGPPPFAGFSSTPQSFARVVTVDHKGASSSTEQRQQQKGASWVEIENEDEHHIKQIITKGGYQEPDAFLQTPNKRIKAPSTCSDEICDAVIRANPLAERLRRANAQLLARPHTYANGANGPSASSKKISLQLLNWRLDCPCELERRDEENQNDATAYAWPSSQVSGDAADVVAATDGTMSSGSTTNGRSAMNGQNLTREADRHDEQGTSSRSDAFCRPEFLETFKIASVFSTNRVGGSRQDDDGDDGGLRASAGSASLAVLRGDQPDLRPRCLSAGLYDRDRDALINRIGKGEQFFVAVDEQEAQIVARKYLRAIKRTPFAKDVLAKAPASWSSFNGLIWERPRHEYKYDPPYEKERYYAMENSSLQSWFHHDNSTASPDQIKTRHCGRSWSDDSHIFEQWLGPFVRRATVLLNAYIGQLFLCHSPSVSQRALELARPPSDDLGFPTPWSLTGVAIYHVVSAILFTNAQLAGVNFLTRKGIELTGGERAQMANETVGTDIQSTTTSLRNDEKTNYAELQRKFVAVSAPVSFRMHECSGDESVRLWDMAKEYANKNAGLKPHAYAGRFWWLTREESADATEKLRTYMGPGTLPVLVLGDVVDVTGQAHWQQKQFRKRFALDSWRGWWRRFSRPEMHLMMRCEKWADRVNIRAILAVEEKDVDQIRNAVRAAIRLVANSKKAPMSSSGGTSTSSAAGCPFSGLGEESSFSAHQEKTAREAVAGSQQLFDSSEERKQSAWSQSFVQEDSVSDPLKLVVMTLAEADKDLKLFENRDKTKEWIPADLLAEWYNRNAIDFASTQGR
ncbi:unnamed protein product, partial [Amoebophrya sp. A120]|eukprot:GSA120T00016439001.1